jgi:secondary thiamine-phosphate synthase enzyme
MLRQDLRRLAVTTDGEGFTNLTALLQAELRASGLQRGLLQLVVLHTSCSLIVNENADPRVLHDLTTYLRALVPQEGLSQPYAHDDEGPDDMPAHIRTALTTTSLGLSFDQGRLVLGTWQAVYLWEHRARGQRRRLSLHLLGE